MCNKAVETCLSALKFVSHWIVTKKLLQKLDNIVSSNDDIDLNDIDAFMWHDIELVKLFRDDVRLNTIYLYNIKLDGDNFDEDDPTNIVLVRLIAQYNWKNKVKHVKIDSQRINVSVMASNKSLEFVYDKK